MTRVALVISVVCLIAQTSRASEPAHDIILYGAEIYRLPLGARQSSLGNSGFALPLNAFSSARNPSAAAFLPNSQAWMEGAVLYGGLSRAAGIGTHIPLAFQSGLSVVYSPYFSGDIFEFDTLSGTSELRRMRPELRSTGAPQGIFHHNQHTIMIALGKKYGLSLPRRAGFSSAPVPLEMGFGGSFKGFWQTLTPGDKVRLGLNVNMDIGATVSLGVDYDLLKKEVNRSLYAGVGVRNVLPTRIMWVYSPTNYSEPVYMSQHLGIGFVDRSGMLNGSWILSAAIERVPDFVRDSVDSSSARLVYRNEFLAGIEGEFWNTVAFRAGVENRVLTLGAGVKYRLIRLDYALRFDHVAISPVRLSLGVEF